MAGQILIDLDTRNANCPIIPVYHSSPFHWTRGRGKGGFSVRVFFIPTVLNEGSNGPVYQDISRLTSVSHRHLHNRAELCVCACR